MSRLSHKVYRLLSSPVLLRKFTNSLLQRKERGYSTFENTYLYIVLSFVRVCNVLFVRFNTLQFALPTGNFVKYFLTNS